MRRLLYFPLIMAACILAATVPVTAATTFPELSYSISVLDTPVHTAERTTPYSFFPGFTTGTLSPGVTFPMDLSTYEYSSGASYGSVRAGTSAVSRTANSELKFSNSVSVNGEIQMFSFSVHYTL